MPEQVGVSAVAPTVSLFVTVANISLFPVGDIELVVALVPAVVSAPDVKLYAVTGVAAADGETDGLKLGLIDADGETDGDSEGLSDGLIDGDKDGLKLGLKLGDKDALGETLGDRDGLSDGLMLGLIEGEKDADGVEDSIKAATIIAQSAVVANVQAVVCGSEALLKIYWNPVP